jgi:hypothetical protein
MHTYTYEGLEPRKIKRPSIFNKIGSHFSSYSPSSQTVKRHVTFLLIQAVFIMVLAVASMYTELQANVADAESKMLTYEQQLALNHSNKDAFTSETSAVLGTSDESINTNNKNDSSIIIQDINKDAEPTLPESAQPAKDEYVIAVYGDSMVDTMGERLEYLEHELTKKYPHTRFDLYNYGMGSNNAEDGLTRWSKPFHYMDRNYPPITEIEPDIIIMGSFAYNVFTPHNRDKHWLALTDLVQRAQQITPNVYMLAEIAPLRRGFGFGPNGVNWSPTTTYTHTGNIIEQLKNAIGLSQTLQVPLIDAYTPSLEDDREEGKSRYVNPSDGIHPSVAGHQFISEIIANTIELK